MKGSIWVKFFNVSTIIYTMVYIKSDIVYTMGALSINMSNSRKQH